MTLLIILGCWAILTGIACMAPCRERGYVTLGDFIFCLCLAPRCRPIVSRITILSSSVG